MTPQLPIFDEDWLPLRAAEKFGFDLPYIVSEDNRLYFRLLSWLEGCVGDRAVKTVKNLREKGVLEMGLLKSLISPVLINVEKDSMNRTQNFEYVTDELLYRITEDFRSTKERPVVKAIKDYLASSGAFVDKLRRAETPLIEAPRTSAEKTYLASRIVYHREDRPEAMKSLQTRRDTKTTYKDMMDAVSKVVQHPDYGKIGNAEYVTMFGYTAKELRAILNTDNVRNELSPVQLTALQLLERTMTELIKRAERMTNDDVVAAMIRIAKKVQGVLAELDTYELPQINARTGKGN